jgi:DNA-binding HxlR family transcriptional regulator
MEISNELDAFCPYYHRAMELIGRRWTGVILMKELEAEGLVQRVVIPEMPVRVEYHLTEKGSALGNVMKAITAWAHNWVVLPKEAAPAGVTR